MYVRLTQLSAKKSLFLVMIFAFLYYFPWLFETLQVIRIHDTLDSEVVHNKILGDFYRNGFDALKLALNNQEPLYTFRRLTQPLSLLYSVFNPFIAYMITDIAVRVIAFWGVYCLARYKSVAPFMSAIVAICFSTSISFTVFLLTIAGIPLLLYFCLKSKDLKNSNLPIYFLLSILIGCHTDLALSGIFTLCLLIPVHTLIFKEKIYFSTLVPITGFTIGLILGNIGLLYAQFLSNIVWHRVDWDLVPYQGVVFSIDTLNLIIKNTISNPWHHANFTQVIAVSSILIFFIFLKKIRTVPIRNAIFLLFSIWVIYIISRSPLSLPIREIHKIFISFQWDRFYFFYSTLIVIFYIFYLNEAKKYSKISMVIILSLVGQLALNIFNTPHINNLMNLINNKPTYPSFHQYYQTNNFSKIKAIVDNHPVMSVGLDPMIAPMNNIVAIDGYYFIYPKSYKDKFRLIIEKSMVLSNKQQYFDGWGSRIYAFYPIGRPETLNYCAASELGVKYFISSEEINSNIWDSVIKINDGIYLNTLNTNICNKLK